MRRCIGPYWSRQHAPDGVSDGHRGHLYARCRAAVLVDEDVHVGGRGRARVGSMVRHGSGSARNLARQARPPPQRAATTKASWLNVCRPGTCPGRQAGGPRRPARPHRRRRATSSADARRNRRRSRALRDAAGREARHRGRTRRGRCGGRRGHSGRRARARTAMSASRIARLTCNGLRHQFDLDLRDGGAAGRRSRARGRGPPGFRCRTPGPRPASLSSWPLTVTLDGQRLRFHPSRPGSARSPRRGSGDSRPGFDEGA